MVRRCGAGCCAFTRPWWPTGPHGRASRAGAAGGHGGPPAAPEEEQGPPGFPAAATAFTEHWLTGPEYAVLSYGDAAVPVNCSASSKQDKCSK